MAAVAAVSPHMGRIDSSGSAFKYEVDLTSISAEGLNVPAGTLVSFAWRRHGKLLMLEVAEVDDDGCVSWEEHCTQVCTLTREDGSGWAPKPCEMQVQAILVNSEGLPSAEGPVVASAALDISHYCAAEALRPRSLSLALHSGGTLHVRIASRWLPSYQGTAGTESSHGVGAGPTASELSMSPATSTASLSTDAGPSVLGPHAMGYASSSPSPQQDGSAGEQRFPHPRDAESCRAPGAAEGEGFLTPRRPGAASPSDAPPTCSTDAASEAGDGAEALARRCTRLARERDEARAEAFAEASAAVQRGIEIEDLKRAKATLLRRLESTESQLLMMMRLDMEASPAKKPASGRAGGAPAPADATAVAGTDAENFFVAALVEAKVALAEKEFEAMELQGKLRAREAALESMAAHLGAVQAEAMQHRRLGGSALRRAAKRSASPVGAPTAPADAPASPTAAEETTPPKAHSLAAAVMALFVSDHASAGKRAAAAEARVGPTPPAAESRGAEGKHAAVGVRIQAHAGPVDVESQ